MVGSFDGVDLSAGIAWPEAPGRVQSYPKERQLFDINTLSFPQVVDSLAPASLPVTRFGWSRVAVPGKRFLVQSRLWEDGQRYR